MAKRIKAHEIGFGTLASDQQQRLIKSNGESNVHRIGTRFLSLSDIFHRLTTMSWLSFFSIIFSVYFVNNVLFALFYLVDGVQNIGATPGSALSNFLNAFFFSVQTYTTIGFGRLNPLSNFSSAVASIEGLVGLLSLAIVSGLLYGRFSRPRAHLVRSKHLLIAPYLNQGTAAMFRLASTRRYSLLLENTVSVSLGINLNENGITKRRFFLLNLELDKINFLNLSWTIVHPINDESPLWGRSFEDLKVGRAEFIILFKAMEETTSQVVIERISYFIDDIVWGAKFLPCIGSTNEGKPVLDLSKIGSFEAAALPIAIQNQAPSILDTDADTQPKASTS